MRRFLIAALAAAALMIGLGAPAPVEARAIRVCVQWSYLLTLVYVNGVWQYRWVRGPCRRWRYIIWPEPKPYPVPFPFPIPFPWPGPGPGPGPDPILPAPPAHPPIFGR